MCRVWIPLKSVLEFMQFGIDQDDEMQSFLMKSADAAKH